MYTNDARTERYLPPENLPAFEDITIGQQHDCGLTADGDGVCWGGINFYDEQDVPSDINEPLINISAGRKYIVLIAKYCILRFYEATGKFNMKITGGCHCGEITYEAELNLDNVVICHCGDCQSLSGSAFRTVAFTENDSFAFLTGDPKVYVKTGASGNKREQTFCSACGSSIYSTSVGDGPKQYGIRLGTVDQRDQITPKKQKWFASSQSWTQALSSLPIVDTA